MIVKVTALAPNGKVTSAPPDTSLKSSQNSKLSVPPFVGKPAVGIERV